MVRALFNMLPFTVHHDLYSLEDNSLLHGQWAHNYT